MSTSLQLVLKDRKISGAVSGGNDYLAIDDRRAGADVPGVVGDFSETLGPIVAAAGENLDRFVHQVHLDSVAVKLDFMNPPLARGDLVDRRRQRGVDESGEGRFRADCRRLLALKRHAANSNSTDRFAWAGSAVAARREHSEASRILPSSPDVKQREDERGSQ